MKRKDELVEETVSLARCVFEVSNSSRRWLLKERLRWLEVLDKLITKNKSQILEVVAKDLNRDEYLILISEYSVVKGLIRWYRRRAEKILRDENRSNIFSLMWGNKKIVTKKIPLGVVGVITPANSPFSIPLGIIIPAILAGNAVVWKPSPDTRATNDFLGKLLRQSFRNFEFSPIEILPPGNEFGEALVRNPEVDRIFFIGSQKTGELIRQSNALVRSIPPILELGGSNAAVVLEDADLDMTARIIVWGRYGVISCNNIKRVYAPLSIYWNLLEKLVAEVRKLASFEKASIPRGQEERYARFIDEYFNYLKFSGEKELLKDCGIRPTKEEFYLLGLLPVLDATISFSFLREETFMPLLPVICVKDEEEAIQLANHENFDLGAVIFTKSKKKFREISERLEASTITHNDAMVEFALPQLPFGGGGKSGWGYVHGPEGLLEFVKRKTVVEERWQAPKPYLFPWTPVKIKFFQKLADFIINLS